MIDLHIASEADATISVIEVDMSEASRFGIMAVDKNDRIVEFQEKPKVPKSNLASMGVYIFTWKDLRKYLIADSKHENSSHDFGNDIIPAMLNDGKKLQAYRFKGYWRDVGTLKSLHEANMDVALQRADLNLYTPNDTTRIYSQDTYSVPQYIGEKAHIVSSIANQGSVILGECISCVISNEAIIESGASCNRCVIMQGAVVKKGAKVNNAIIAPFTVIKENEKINLNSNEVVLIDRKAGR